MYPLLRKFIFPAFGIFHLFACNAAKTISIEALGDTPGHLRALIGRPTTPLADTLTTFLR